MDLAPALRYGHEVFACGGASMAMVDPTLSCQPHSPPRASYLHRS